MLSIDDLNDNILDLNKYNDGKDIVLNITSTYDEDNSYASWHISIPNNDTEFMSLTTSGSKLIINVDLENFKDSDSFTLSNKNGDILTVNVISNKKMSKPKRYALKIARSSKNKANKSNLSSTSDEILCTKKNDQFIIRFNVLSTINGKFTPCIVKYDGAPLSFDISLPTSNEEGSNICSLRLLNDLVSDYTSVVVLGQEGSSNELTIEIKYTVSRDEISKDKIEAHFICQEKRLIRN